MLRAATAWLRGRGDDEARLDIELLLSRALGTDRAGLYARLGDELSAGERVGFEELLTRLPTLRLDGPTERVASPFLWGRHAVPIAWSIDDPA